MNQHLFKTSVAHASQGFTLVELMVTVSIFALITTALLVNARSFNGSVTLTNLAYDVALAVREAQNYGVNVRQVEGVFAPGYGVYIAGNFPDRIRVFADRDDNGQWTATDTTIDDLTLRGGHSIDRVCGAVTYGDTCAATQNVHIVFQRPNPEARIMRGNGDIWSYAEIHLVSPEGNERIVEVNATGQISIRKS